VSVDPDAVGDPPQAADDYLQDANAEDPRNDPRAPAHEPAGPADPDPNLPSGSREPPD
jgi:hypothetical protein